MAAEEDAAHEFGTIVLGLPLALSIVGARLATRPRRSLAREAADLRTERRRLAGLALDEETSVEAVLDRSYCSLAEDAGDLYRMCALHPGREFGVDVVAAGAGWNSDLAESTFDTLLEANFLIEIGDRRFAFHDLLRVHARQHAEERQPRTYRAV